MNVKQWVAVVGINVISLGGLAHLYKSQVAEFRASVANMSEAGMSNKAPLFRRIERADRHAASRARKKRLLDAVDGANLPFSEELADSLDQLISAVTEEDLEKAVRKIPCSDELKNDLVKIR